MNQFALEDIARPLRDSNSKASNLCYCYNSSVVAILLCIYGMQAKSTLYYSYVCVTHAKTPSV